MKWMTLLGWTLMLLFISNQVNAACQFRTGSGDVSYGPPGLSLANGEVGYITITVNNHLALNDLAVYVDNNPVGAVSKNGQKAFSVAVNAPPWGSGSGQIYKTLDVMQTGESKCWDNQLSIQLSYSPGQAEIAAQQAAILAQQATQQKQTGEQQTNILFWIGALVFIGLIIGVGYLFGKRGKKN